MEGSFFATEFIVFGSGDLIKIEAYDMEPVLMPDRTIALQKGKSLRMVMPKESAETLRDVLVRHLERNAPGIHTEKGNGFAVYASAAKSYVPGTASHRDLIGEVISKLDNLAELPFTELQAAVTEILSAIAVYRVRFSTGLCNLTPDACLIGTDDIDRRISEIAAASQPLSDSAKNILFALIGYTVLCEPVENRHLDYIAVVLRELLKRETEKADQERRR